MLPRDYLALLTVALSFLPDSRRVVNALTGLFALTARARSTTKWLRRAPVRLAEVRFLGLPMEVYDSLYGYA